MYRVLFFHITIILQEQAQEQVGEDKQSSGRSQLDQSERGHRGEKQAARSEAARGQQKRLHDKPGKTDQERTLGTPTKYISCAFLLYYYKKKLRQNAE